MVERRVLLEVKLERESPPEQALAIARGWERLGFVVDPAYRAVPMGAAGDSPHVTVIVRGVLRANAKVDELMQQPEVAGLWDDSPIAPTRMVA
ncbi:MAG TPA: hypothetical protein VIK33_12900 [Anaerolineae bacterium]